MLSSFVLFFVRGRREYISLLEYGVLVRRIRMIREILYRGQWLRVKRRGILVVILQQLAGGVRSPRGLPSVGVPVPSIETPGVHRARDLRAVPPECKRGVFREFGVREWRVFEFVEELKDVNINMYCVQREQFIEKVGATEGWVVKLVQKFEASVATEARSQDLAKTRRDILAEG
jgi:hypothetical protein